MAKDLEVLGNKIHFGSKLTWYVSSPQEKFLYSFATALTEGGVLQIAGHHIPVLQTCEAFADSGVRRSMTMLDLGETAL